MWAEGHIGEVLSVRLEFQAVFNLLYLCCFGESKTLHTFFKSLCFLPDSSKPYWFSKQLRGLILLVSYPRARVPNMWFEHLASPGRISKPVISPSSSVSPTKCVWVPYYLFCLPMRVHIIFLYSLGYRRGVLVPTSISTRVTLYIVVVLTSASCYSSSSSLLL